MKKHIIKITESQFKKLALLEDGGQITITSKSVQDSPQAFTAAKDKSKSTDAQINVALGTTTNSDGGNGVETVLDPKSTTTQFYNDIQNAKKTGMETTFVAPIEDFTDPSQVGKASSEVSNISGIDESRKRLCEYNESGTASGSESIYGADLLDDDSIDYEECEAQGIVPDELWDGNFNISVTMNFVADPGDYWTPPYSNYYNPRYGGDCDKVMSLIKNIKDERIRELVLNKFEKFCENIEVNDDYDGVGDEMDESLIRITKSAIKEARREYLLKHGKIYEKKNLYNRRNS